MRSGKSSGMSRDVEGRRLMCSKALHQARRGRRQGTRATSRRRAHSLPPRRRIVRLRGRAGGRRQLGLDLELLAERSHESAENPPEDPGPADAPVTRVFAFRIECSAAEHRS